jgi:uncharacterized protein (DUF362 family)
MEPIMNRREFFKNAGIAGASAIAFLSLDKSGKVLANTLAMNTLYVLVSLSGDDPAKMFEKGIAQLGGMRKFVKKNSIVAVTPDIGWNAVPERSANTNPALVKKIVEMCRKAGAKEVLVLNYTYDNWQDSYKHSGIEKAVKDAGGKMVLADKEEYYTEVAIPNGKKLKKATVPDAVLKADVLINVPVLKANYQTRVSAAMQNLMGVVWDRHTWYRNDINQCIADFAAYKRPALNVVDAFAVIKKNGPKGLFPEDVVQMHKQFISSDIVAVDAAAVKAFGENPDAITYVRLAKEAGTGKYDVKKIDLAI